jgi:hypothetical protein
MENTRRRTRRKLTIIIIRGRKGGTLAQRDYS